MDISFYTLNYSQFFTEIFYFDWTNEPSDGQTNEQTEWEHHFLSGSSQPKILIMVWPIAKTTEDGVKRRTPPLIPSSLILYAK